MNTVIENYISGVMPITELLSHSLSNELINLLRDADRDGLDDDKKQRLEVIHSDLLSLAYEKLVVILSLVNINYCLEYRYQNVRYTNSGELIELNRGVMKRKKDEFFKVFEMIYNHDQGKIEGIKKFLTDLQMYSVASSRFADMIGVLDQFTHDVNKFFTYYMETLRALNVHSEYDKAVNL